MIKKLRRSGREYPKKFFKNESVFIIVSVTHRRRPFIDSLPSQKQNKILSGCQYMEKKTVEYGSV